MSDSSVRRKLTVNFYADVTAYGRLIRRDEMGTHRRNLELPEDKKVLAKIGLNLASAAIWGSLLGPCAHRNRSITGRIKIDRRNDYTTGQDLITSHRRWRNRIQAAFASHPCQP